MLIKITQDHINRGVVGNCSECPTALAINDVLKPEFHAVVSDRFILIHTGNYEWMEPLKPIDIVAKVRVPQIVAYFIKMFDRENINLPPIQFEIPINQFCKEA